jgi:hypothetical protein
VDRVCREGLLDSEFHLCRHEAATAMELVYNLHPNRARTLHDRTVLEIRRTLLPITEIPKISLANLVGTRGKALGRYCDQLSAQDFAKLAFLMRGLSPTALILAGRVDWVLDGFPNAQPLFPSEFGSCTVEFQQ